MSYGAFSGTRLVGFILNSCNVYKGRKAVFDVGTGVIPEHRGKKVFTNLFKYAQRELEERKIERYYLEVLQQNERAIALYKRMGFSITREFAVLKARAPSKKENREITCIGFDKFHFQRTGDCKSIEPSYEHSSNILRLNPELYSVAYVGRDTISAFCVFSKANGQILQIGYQNIEDLRSIIQSILLKYNDITVKNVDMSESQVLEMLYSVGFKQIAKQFEMVKDLHM